jgi:plastocyanin domain-containing protein
MTLLVNLLGVALILVIVAWFWLSRSKVSFTQAEKVVEIKVENGVYQPANIEAQANQSITLRFVRKDPSPCAEIVTFNSLNISRNLPLNEAIDIPIAIKTPGIYEFTCQMGMYRGKLNIKS